ncbi:gluconolaconase [Catellatospora citrea]|uniref:PQQ-dependent sugar dehydrogenase n=1 Tax=Catellatospora citrea TaxID=53366 RepID=UPI0033FCEDF1
MPPSFRHAAGVRPKPRIAAAAALAAGLVLALSACTATNDSSDPPLPAGASTAPTLQAFSELSPVPLSTARGVAAGAAAGRSLNLPRGWSAEVWAAVPGARLAAWTPDGRLVVSTGRGGSLMLLTPQPDGRGPAVTTLLDGLDNPQGVALTTQQGRDIIVVGEETRLVAWDYAGGAVTNRRVILDGLPGGGHGSKMVAVRDGQVFYNVGSATNSDAVDRTSTPQRATIAQVGLDGTGNRTLATGVRNGEGLSFAPDGTLFAAINQADNQPYPFRDASGQYGETVPEYVNENPVDQISRITAGTELGWPYCLPDIRGHDDLTDLGYVDHPVTNPNGDELDCAGIDRTPLGLPAHSAPVGFVFTNGSGLPDALADGALITAHGSWNRKPPREPYVAYSAWDAGSKSLTPAKVLVTGFQNADGTRWGRCVDAVPGPDASIYVTDDAAGLVYRLTPGR